MADRDEKMDLYFSCGAFAAGHGVLMAATLGVPLMPAEGGQSPSVGSGLVNLLCVDWPSLMSSTRTPH